MRNAKSTTWFLAGSAVIAVALLLLPATRSTVMLQLRRGTPLKFVLRDKSVEQVLREHPNDAGLALAALGKNAPLARYEELSRRSPNDPVVSTLGCISAVQDISYLKKDESSPTDPFYGLHPERAHPASLPHVQRAIDLARQGLRVEPDNALLECMLAHFLIAKGDDKAALAAADRAATRKSWEWHASDYSRAMMRLRSLQQGGLDATERTDLADHYPDHHEYGRLRQLARSLVWFSVQERPRNPQRAFELRFDIMKIAALMRDKGMIIDGLVAFTISSIGTSRVMTKSELNQATGKLRGIARDNARKKLNSDAAAALFKRYGPSDFLGSESATWQAYRAMTSAYINAGPTQPTWRFCIAWLGSTTLLATAVWLIVLLVVASAFWLVHHKQPHEDVRWRFSDWALLALASLAMLAVATILTWGREWYEAYQADVSGFDAAEFAGGWAMEASRTISFVSAALPLGLVFGVLICVARLAGGHRLPKPCVKMIARWFLRISSVFLFGVMLTYTLLMIPLPRLQKPLDDSVYRMLGGEVRAMKAWAAQQKIPGVPASAKSKNAAH